MNLKKKIKTFKIVECSNFDFFCFMITMYYEHVLSFKGSSSVNLINEDVNEEAVDYLFYCLSTLNNPSSPTSYGNGRQYFLSCLSTFVKMFRDGTNTGGSILVISF